MERFGLHGDCIFNYHTLFRVLRRKFLSNFMIGDEKFDRSVTAPGFSEPLPQIESIQITLPGCAHSSSINSCEMSCRKLVWADIFPGGNLIVGFFDRTLFVIKAGESRVWQRKYSHRIHLIAMSPDCKHLAIAFCDQYSVATLEMGTNKSNYIPQSKRLRCLAWSAKGIIALGSHHVSLYRVSSNAASRVPASLWKTLGTAIDGDIDDKEISALAFFSDGALLASSSDGDDADEIVIWNVESGQSIITIATKCWATFLSFSPNSHFLLSVQVFSLQIWNLATHECVHDWKVTYSLHSQTKASWSPCSKYVAWSDRDTFRIFSVDGVYPGCLVLTQSNKTRTVSFSQRGDEIFTFDTGGRFSRWVSRFDTGIPAMRFAPNQQREHIIPFGDLHLHVPEFQVTHSKVNIKLELIRPLLVPHFFECTSSLNEAIHILRKINNPSYIAISSKLSQLVALKNQFSEIIELERERRNSRNMNSLVFIELDMDSKISHFESMAKRFVEAIVNDSEPTTDAILNRTIATGRCFTDKFSSGSPTFPSFSSRHPRALSATELESILEKIWINHSKLCSRGSHLLWSVDELKTALIKYDNLAGALREPSENYLPSLQLLQENVEHAKSLMRNFQGNHPVQDDHSAPLAWTDHFAEADHENYPRISQSVEALQAKEINQATARDSKRIGRGYESDDESGDESNDDDEEDSDHEEENEENERDSFEDHESFSTKVSELQFIKSGHSKDFEGWDHVISKDGKWLAMATDHSTVLVDVNTGKEQWTYPRESFRIAFSPDSSRFAATGNKNKVRIFDTYTGVLIAKIKGYIATIHDVAWSAENIIATLCNGEGVRLWGPDGNFLMIFAKTGRQIITVAFSPDGSRLATGSSDCKVRMWEVTSGRLLWQSVNNGDYFKRFSFSPDGTKLATSICLENLFIWDMATYQCQFQVQSEDVQLESKLTTSLNHSPFRALHRYI